MKNSTHFLLLLLCIITGNLFAQEYNIKKIDSLISVVQDLGSDVKNVDKAIALAKKALQYSKEINYTKGVANNALLVAALSYNMGNNNDVITYSSIAKEVLDKSNQGQSIENLRIRAMSFTNLGFTKKAREELYQALQLTYKIPRKDGSKFMRANVYTALSLSFETETETNPRAIDSLMNYSKKAYNEYKGISPKYPDIEDHISLASVNLGAYCLNFKKNLDSVQYYLDKALSLSKKNNDVAVQCLANQNLGKMYFLRKQYQKSIPYYTQALSLTPQVGDVTITRDLYQDISKSYDSLKDDSKTKEYLAKYIKLNDSITDAEKAAMKLPMEQILNENEKKLSASKSWYTTIIIAGSLLLIIFVYLSYLFFKKFRTEKNSKQEKDKLLVQSKKEIEKKDSTKYETLSEIIDLATIDSPMFYMRFEEFYPEFCEALKQKAPNLLLSELKCCALLRLNFSAKEIARFTNSTVRAIEQRKYRIRKKLNIPSEEDINAWMINLV